MKIKHTTISVPTDDLPINVMDTEANQEETTTNSRPVRYGTPELLQSRLNILHYSLPQAKTRLIHTGKRKREYNSKEDEDAATEKILSSMATMSLQCSEIGDDMPLSSCAIAKDASMVATGSWTGTAKLWSMPSVQHKVTFTGHHTGRVTDVAFHPHATCNFCMGGVATASTDHTAILWGLDGEKLMSYQGHVARLARIAFHPFGDYLGTASFDHTWRLWDVRTGVELLLQEGHSRSVYGIAFQNDGALVASCGMDALTRVWDLRNGKSLMALEGHAKLVYGVDFSPSGYHLATGSEDNTCRVWDLRKEQCLYVIPAHGSLVSQVKYEPLEGRFLVTSSFDKTVRIWSALDFKLVKTLAGHEGSVAGVDVSADGRWLGTVSHDHTVKLWSS